METINLEKLTTEAIESIRGGVGGSFKKTNGYGLKMIPLRMTMIGVTISNLK
jgi:hypothetical protein